MPVYSFVTLKNCKCQAELTVDTVSFYRATGSFASENYESSVRMLANGIAVSVYTSCIQGGPRKVKPTFIF